MKIGFLTPLALFLICCNSGNGSDAQKDGSEGKPPVHGAEHGDHSPKHGGVFFMALDYKHHLEGVLYEPGKFRIYLYDSRTKPLDPARAKEARGTVFWGELPNPPGWALAATGEGAVLEAVLDRKIEFPLALTVLLHLPGSDSAAKPELFTFTFSEYTKDASAPAKSMDSMDHSKHR